MIRLLFLIGLIGAAGVAAAWLGQQPGRVSLVWWGYQMETSAAFLVLMVTLLLTAAIAVYHMLRRLIWAPFYWGHHRNLHRLEQAIGELTHSVAALAASDMRSATLHTRKAEKILGTTPLTLLLRAQISKNEGDDTTTKQILEQLLTFPETEYVAAKSLADAAHKQHLLPQAMSLAKRARSANPQATGGAATLLNLLLEDRKWDEAAAHITQSRKSGAFSRHESRAAEGKLALSRAKHAKSEGHYEEAFAFVEDALRKLEDPAEAVELAAWLAIKRNKHGRAQTLIQRQWRITPTEALAELFHEATQPLSDRKKERLAEKMRASHGGHPLNVRLD